MKRRQFLKSVFGVAAGVVVAPSVVKATTREPTNLRNRDTMRPDEIRRRYDEAKFHTGDRVHISELFPEYMRHFRGKGKDATVISFQSCQNGRGVEGAKEILYDLNIDDTGEGAWYPEDLLTPIKRPSGAYLKTSELKCLRCGYITKLPNGYYEFGTRVVCNCGNVSMFMANVEIARSNVLV